MSWISPILVGLKVETQVMMANLEEQLYAIETAIERDIIENANFAWSGAFGHKGIEQVGNLLLPSESIRQLNCSQF